ncbi:MAG: EamA family transporter [Alphaproteobacteria bacterium]|nr:EamA family transporter [Alphaproteobacteria bacterium]
MPFDRSARAWPGAALALGSAVLFGASTPLAKLLLQATDPWLLAGLLYLGSGLGLAGLHFGRRLLGGPLIEAPLRRSDLPWLGAVILAGGVIGPLLLMLGLTRTAASSAALLLNLEGLATMAIAWLVFHEHTDRRLLLGAFAILAGAVLLSWQGGPTGFGWGSIAIAGACVAWGIDNNLTRKLSAADPVSIAMVKGLAAGAINLALAVTSGAQWPPPSAVLAAAIVGFLGYGVSLVMFVLGLRHLGTARTSAYFSLAPFIGAIVALALFHTIPSIAFCAAALLMGIGLTLHLVEWHDHEHLHEAMEHEHRHVHDAHHRHAHTPDDPPGEPHVHQHVHAPLRHRHSHYPDLHHRHGHPG